MPRFKAVSGCEEPAPVADIRDLRAGPPRSSASGGLRERQRGLGPLHVEPSGPGGLQPRVSLFSDLASGVPGDHLTLRMGKLRQSAGKEATGLVARLCPRGAPPRWKTGRREFTTWPRPQAAGRVRARRTWRRAAHRVFALRGPARSPLGRSALPSAVGTRLPASQVADTSFGCALISGRPVFSQGSGARIPV